ncbi:MAG: acyl-CoA thioesterase [bacterium]
MTHITVTPRWSDMDMLGHANNACFLTYIEEARINWLNSLPAPWFTDEFGPVVASVNIQYKRPITSCEPLLISFEVSRFGGSSLTTHSQMADQKEEIIYAEVEVVLVWISRQSGRARKIPKDLLKALQE